MPIPNARTAGTIAGSLLMLIIGGEEDRDGSRASVEPDKAARWLRLSAALHLENDARIFMMHSPLTVHAQRGRVLVRRPTSFHTA